MKKQVFIFVSFFLSMSVKAEEVYPKRIPNRIYGSDQIRVGSCASEADAAALEHVFANAGWPATVSTFYRHARLWRDKPDSKYVYLNKTAETDQILDLYGEMIPDFMLPEDGRYVDGNKINTYRPNIADMGVFDPEFIAGGPPALKREHFTFAPGFTNSSDLAAIKQKLREGKPLTLSIQSSIIYKFDTVTGLLSVPYESFREQLASEEIDHSVAVVGFDDSLSALIIRNSWNDVAEIAANADTRMSDKVKDDLTKMKNKIHSVSLPGYYAIPYSYIEDLIKNPNGGFNEIFMDYKSFIDRYMALKEKYKVFLAPYTCDKNYTVQMLRRGVTLKQKALDKKLSKKELAEAEEKYYSFLKVQANPAKRIFRFAKLSYNSSLPQIDRLKEFYDGKFEDYYCAGDSVTMYPMTGDLKKPLTSTDAPGWLLKVSLNPSDISAWNQAISWFEKYGTL